MPSTTAERWPAQPLLNEEVSPTEAIVRVLEQAGIDMVFGMPGGNTFSIFNALYDHQETVRTVLVREEARAGHEDHLIPQMRRGERGIDVDALALEQIFEADIAQARNSDGAHQQAHRSDQRDRGTNATHGVPPGIE